MLKLHNAVVDRLRARGVSEDGLFEEARRITRWHYQWVVLHDFLPRLIGNELASALLPRDRATSWAIAHAHPARIRGCGLSLRPQPDPGTATRSTPTANRFRSSPT